MVDVGIVAACLELTKSVAELFGLVESLEGKVEKLARCQLTAGLRNLRQACSSERETETLIREARNCFNRAVALEAGNRQAIAYLSLALCHSYLGDRANSTATLQELLGISPKPSVNVEMLASSQALIKGKSATTKAIAMGSAALFGSQGSMHVLARRAKFTPESIRRRLAPTKEELLLYLKWDPDVAKFVRIQLQVGEYLGEATPWMETQGVTRAQIEHALEE